MLISPRLLFFNAVKNNYAVGAFNFYNIDTLSSILKAAEAEQSPVIVQIYSSHFLHYDGGAVIAAAALKMIHDSAVPAALHLDHSASFNCILKAIQCGFNSVMYDGSSLELNENILTTTKVVEVAGKLDIFTEAEIGKIVRIGSSDEHDTAAYTTVEDAVELVRKTGVDSLAPAVGTAHGIYKQKPAIRFDLLKEIAEAVKIPLVLHGGSGIPDDMIRESINLGIRKVNVGTELKYMWSKTMLKQLEAGEKEPITLSSHAIKAVEEVVRNKIKLFGSSGMGNEILRDFHTLDKS